MILFDWGTLVTIWYYDYDARDEYLNATIGWFTQPLVTGDYPDSVRDNLGDVLPSFTDEEANLIKGATDFLAIDHYTTWLVME